MNTALEAQGNNIIIFDFEVFKYDTLLGALVINRTGINCVQTWDLDAVRDFYDAHQNDIWVGHNNSGYDNFILETIVNHRNPYNKSCDIIKKDKRGRLNLKLYNFDLMTMAWKRYSLKLTELLVGKKISTTEVDFDLDRPLANEEKLKTESYNRDDLDQTLYNFNMMFDLFKLRLDIIREFDLDLSYMSVTGTQLAAKVLNSHRIEGIENMKVKPRIYDNLKLENKDLIDFYLNEKFRSNEKAIIHVGNAEISVGAGGIHSAIKQYHTDKAMYFDVSGYYNLIMINNGLLPRTMDEESRKKYIYMYYEQLKMKKTNPVKRGMYKTILLSVFGATMNEYCDFYDPEHGSLITITGQIYLVDLLEKLKDLVTIVQTNTDGLIVEPFDWNDEQKVIEIVEEWEQRTGFVIKKEHVFDLYQRDVNCYFCKDDNGKVVYKGEAVKNYDTSPQSYANCNLFECKEPPIIAKGIIEFLANGVLPETLVYENKYDMTLFQYFCKKNTFDYTQYEVTDKDTSETNLKRLSGIDRVFAWNDPTKSGMVYKYKNVDGKTKKAKISNLPPSVFLYDDDIRSEEVSKELSEKIDYDYYVGRIYERCTEFVRV